MFVDGATSLAEAISNRFVSPASNVCKAFFEADVEGAPSFADVELSAFGAMNDVYTVVRQTVELFRDVHLGLRTMAVGVGANEGTCSAICLITVIGVWSVVSPDC